MDFSCAGGEGEGRPSSGRRHHVLAVPLPAQGHVNPLMRLCRLLAHHHGFLVTFVNTGPLQQRFEERSGESERSAESGPPIRTVHLPMAPAHAQVISGSFSLADLIRSGRGLHAALEDLVHSLSTQGPPVTCLLSDAFMSASTQPVSDKLKLPRMVFFPCCQALNLLYTYICIGTLPPHEAVHAALQRDRTPCAPISKQLPGLLPLVYRDLPFFKHVHDDNDEVTRILCEEFGLALANTHRLNTFVVNSFSELEGPAFQARHELSLATTHLPHVYPIGPLVEDLSLAEGNNTSLWKEDNDCLTWLDNKAPRSVLYISFGSITLFSKAQFEEFLFGLEASSQSFLFVFRPDLVDDASYTSFPPELFTNNAGVGYVVAWAPQVRVLSHPSIGGFVTHCGWNSVLEAITNGVPMLCWPYFADQPFDAKYIVDEWKIGLRTESSHNGEELIRKNDIERLIKTLMQSMQGDAMREKAMHLSSIARDCHLLGGSSFKNIQTLIKSLG